jgi:hypothetical protein
MQGGGGAANGSNKAAPATVNGSPGGSKGPAAPAGSSPSSAPAASSGAPSVPTAGNVTREEDFEGVLEHGLQVMAKEVGHPRCMGCCPAGPTNGFKSGGHA